MTKLEQHLLEINKYLKLDASTPTEILLAVRGRLKEVYQLTYHLEDDENESEFFHYIEQLLSLLEEVPSDFRFEEERKDCIRGCITHMSWDNFIIDEDEDEDNIEEGGYMTLGSMFYNKLEWVAEGSDNEYLKEFATDYGGNLLIDLLNELEVICNQ